MEKNYEFLDHIADAKFRAYGPNLEIAFVNAALAMFSILKDPKAVSEQINKKINISSKKKESLLYDFLEELLFLLDVDGFLLSKINSLKISQQENEFNLTASIAGDSHKNYPEIHGNVKSITYNDMLIDENFSDDENKKVMLQVVVDL